jgi:3-oxoacyl-[acyl-carrier protein] reductase
MDLGLAGKGYLVVGGTSGMGLATARVLVAEGASVVIAGRNLERGEALAKELGAAGSGVVAAVQADVSVEGDPTRMVAEAVDVLGRLDGVAVMTGILGHESADVSDDRWTEVFRDVMLGTIRSVQAAVPYLIERGGTVVTTSAYSISAPEFHRVPYASMKSAVATFTKAFAKEYGKHNIRINCVCPGAIETEPMAALRGHLAETRGYPYEEAIERVMVEEWGLKVALGRPGKPQEVGELMAFLLSPMAGYVTGALINIDGGTDF